MSAFGYFGSKLRIAAKLCDELPPHNAWVELLCGSAAMTLAKEPAPIEVINDINGEIINFFRQLQENEQELVRLVQVTPYARDEFELARIGDPDISKVERARRFFIAAMMAINGSFGQDAGGFSFSNSYSRREMEARVSRWHGMPAHLHTVAERLKRVRIENKDCLELFKNFRNRPGTLAYFDPPYNGKRTRGYDNDATEEFHERLLTSVDQAKCMVFISGYENELYEDVLTKANGWGRETIKAVTKGNNGKSFERQEVIWFNSVYLEAKAKNRVPVRLNKTERKNQKLNPERA